MRETLYKIWHHLILDRPWLVILVILAVLGAAATQVRHFHLDASAESLMLEGSKDMEYYRKVRARYGSDDYLIITFNPEAPLFSDTALQQLKSLRDELAALDSIESMMTMLDVPLLDSPRLTFSELEEGPPTLLDEGVDHDLVREEFRTSPLYEDLIMNQAADTTAMLATLAQDEETRELLTRRAELRVKQSEQGLSSEEQQELERINTRYDTLKEQNQKELAETIATVREILDRYRDRANIHLGGVPMIAVDMIDFVRGDIKTFGVGVAIFIILLLAFTFQRLRWVLVPAAVSGGVALGMTGFLGFMDWPVTVVSSNFISLVLIITLSLMVHLIVRHRELHVQMPDPSGRELMRETVDSKLKPSVYTALTTMIAFGAMVFADIRPVIDFGLMMVCAVAMAFLLTFSLFPAALSWLSPGPEPRFPRDVTARFNRKVAGIASRRGATVGIVFLVLTIVAAAGITRITVENRFIDYFKPSTEIYQGMALIDKELGGTTPLDVILDPSQAYLESGAETAAPAASDEAGSQETSGAEGQVAPEESGEDDPWSDDAWSDGGGTAQAESDAGDDQWGDDAWSDDWGEDEQAEEQTGPIGGYWFNEYQLTVLEDIHDYLDSLPETGKVLSVATTLKIIRHLNQGENLNAFEMGVMFKRLPPEMSEILFDPYMSEDGNQIRYSIRIIDSTPNLNRDDLLEKIRGDLIEQFDLSPEQVNLSGMLVLYNNVMQSLVKSQFVTLVIVFSAMMLMFAGLFRSLKMAVIGPMPTLIASIGVMGLIGWVGLPLDIMTMTIAAITIGIGVHDTIHYTHRFQDEVRERGDYEAAMHESHVQVGRAMVYTTVIIIAGFSILTLSNFMPTIYFGLLTGVAMAFALVSNLFLLPVLLKWMKPFDVAQLSR